MPHCLPSRTTLPVGSGRGANPLRRLSGRFVTFPPPLESSGTRRLGRSSISISMHGRSLESPASLYFAGIVRSDHFLSHSFRITSFRFDVCFTRLTLLHCVLSSILSSSFRFSAPFISQDVAYRWRSSAYGRVAGHPFPLA